MKSKKVLYIMVLLFLATVVSLQAQPRSVRKSTPESDSSPDVYYRLDYVIRELDGEKIVDTRKYSLWVQSGKSQKMTTVSEMPLLSELPNKPPSVKYRDIGVSISSTITERNTGPQLRFGLNINDALPPEGGIGAPIFRKVSLDAVAFLPLGKSTTVGMVEDTGSRHMFQVDVTATKLK